MKRGPKNTLNISVFADATKVFFEPIISRHLKD